ncbi:MAG: hypothetical protein NSGCLCUN01_04040 [uncultured Clostridium sp.]
MNSNLQKLITVLSELRCSSKQATEDNIMDLMNHYNLLFLGAKSNTIYSQELPRVLRTFFNFPIELDELNQLIPEACNILQMEYEPMIQLSDVGNPKIFSYAIILW